MTTETKPDKAGFTPGPWHVRETEKAIEIRQEQQFITVAAMSKDDIGSDDREAYAAAMADARLIAAAPEMFEALKAVVQAAYVNHANAPMLYSRIQAALRRAEGK